MSQSSGQWQSGGCLSGSLEEFDEPLVIDEIEEDEEDEDELLDDIGCSFISASPDDAKFLGVLVSFTQTGRNGFAQGVLTVERASWRFLQKICCQGKNTTPTGARPRSRQRGSRFGRATTLIGVAVIPVRIGVTPTKIATVPIKTAAILTKIVAI